MDNPRNDFFHRLLIESGMEKGMRILDAGCGAGDVSILAAELTGDAGEVVGVDISQDALETAKRAVDERCLSGISFMRADIAELPDALGVFDMIIGRRVLMYQNNMARSIGGLLAFLSKNGKMVFQESERMIPFPPSPLLALHAKVQNWIWDTVAKEGGNIHGGAELYSGMKNAGLSISLLRAEAILHTHESGSDLGWAAKMMAPRMIKHNVVTTEELALETLEERLREERRRSTVPFVRDMAFGICAENRNSLTRTASARTAG